MKPKIFIDAGHNHSLFNTGASGNGMREQDISFEVGFLLAQRLAPDFDVTLSRPTLTTNLGQDNSSAINARWQMANERRADAFISLHVNAGGGTGVETFFFRECSERSRRSQELAEQVNTLFAHEMKLRNRGVKADTQTAVGSIGVLRRTNMPAILVELAFIDSPAVNPDVAILRNKRAEMADAIAKGVYQYFGVPETGGTVKFDILGRIVHVDGYISPDGVTWVRARNIIEAMGYRVDWNVKERAVMVV